MRRLPVVDQASSLRLDGARNFVYPADVRGRFTRARYVVFAVLIVIYGALPWIQIKGHPALFLDIVKREFYLFGATFNSQDIWMTVFLLTGAAFGLVYATALLGRVWCGWACPQTVLLEGVFRRIERLVEGPRDKRIRRSQAGLSFDKVWRKALLHTLYLAVALVVAHVFLSYFVSLPATFAMVRGKPSAHPEAFLVVMSLTAILYANFSWFREQFCVVLCPYGRLQSVLLDQDSLVIGYDTKRGEPRGHATAKKKSDETLGDCVDCNRCVTVCPTGIDIRNGLQMDCVACAACIDACDEIMDRLHRKRGLIRYDSQRGLAGEATRILRPRIGLYSLLMVAGLAATAFAFGKRNDFEANVLRVSGAPYVLDGDSVRNAFTIHLVNKRGGDATFVIEPEAPSEAAFVIPLSTVRLRSLESSNVPVFVTSHRDRIHIGSFVKLRIRIVGANDDQVISAPFLGPTSIANTAGAK